MVVQSLAKIYKCTKISNARAQPLFCSLNRFCLVSFSLPFSVLFCLSDGILSLFCRPCQIVALKVTGSYLYLYQCHSKYSQYEYRKAVVCSSQTILRPTFPLCDSFIVLPTIFLLCGYSMVYHWKALHIHTKLYNASNKLHSPVDVGLLMYLTFQDNSTFLSHTCDPSHLYTLDLQGME